MSDKVICNCGAVNPNLSMKCHSCRLPFPTKDLESRLAEANRKVEELNFNILTAYSVNDQWSQENARLKTLLGEASSVIDELLTAEAEENNKKVKLVDGIKYYPITGRYRTNAAFYKLAEVLAKLQEVTK